MLSGAQALQALGADFRRGPQTDEWHAAVLQELFSAPRGAAVDPELVIAAVLRCVAADASRQTLAEVWSQASSWLPAGAPSPSWRWRGLAALLAQEGEGALRRLSAQPLPRSVAGLAIYGRNVADGSYPRRIAERAECSCAACNCPTSSSDFLDPRGEFGFGDLCGADRRAFFDLYPRDLLEWSLDAWRHEGRFDRRCADEWGGAQFAAEYEASFGAARRVLVAGAEESLRWASPGRACRGAWVAAVVRAALRR